METRPKTLLAALSLICATHCAAAAFDKALYELQERCAKGSAAFFAKLGAHAAVFDNHYNPALNGCFILVTTVIQNKRKDVTYIQWELWNVNEDRKVDLFSYRPSRPPVQACLAGDFMSCRGAERFGAAVHHYLER